MTSSQTFTIGVTDAPPSTPVDSDATTDSVVEGAAAGTTVGVTVSSTDVNGPPLTYSLTGDTSGGGFTINATTGVITVADPTKIDFESSGAGHSYTVIAQVSDGTDVSSQTFTIGVTDAPPSTPVDADAAANSVVEGAANGTTVGVTASSTDVNGPAVTYSLTGDTSGGGFTINATTGVVTVADNTKIDFEKRRRPQLHRDRAGQRRHGYELADLRHRRHRRAAVDPGRQRRGCQPGLNERARGHACRRDGVVDRRQRSGRNLFADRRHLGRRLHRRSRDRRRHRRRFQQGDLHLQPDHLRRHGAGERRQRNTSQQTFAIDVIPNTPPVANDDFARRRQRLAA